MLLRAAVTDDIPAILQIEQTPLARTYVGQWTEQRHLATLTGGDARYLVNASETGSLQAYVILRGFSEDSSAIELKRVVVAMPERGLGRKVVTEVQRMVFEEMGAHRLFLDVFEDNARARHLYESLGFTYEGVMRDAANRDGVWYNLHLMSMLENEYRGRPAKSAI
ncbi:MAG TPA: GNAT family protein [Terracidiphilus sp.]|jgi:RimJ/RimL family protein N-acetyltransferase|nr:GNAT family protein [Terracidiphilus sp.]